MKKTAEYVSIGHPDKIADFISSKILDYLIERDEDVKYAVEVMIKDNAVVLGGEIKTFVNLNDDVLFDLVINALERIGYDEVYSKRWGDNAINPSKITIINLIGKQSNEINQGVKQDGWGDQGVFVGYACNDIGKINKELRLARTLCHTLYHKALCSSNLGIDIKTQVTLEKYGKVETVVVAIPMLEDEDLTKIIVEALGETPKQIIVNGTGSYKKHSSIADCGVTGRKLACDFYSTACPIGGGSPWTKDPSKADLTLNIYARHLAMQHLKDNDECFVYLSSCIGKAELMSAVVVTRDWTGDDIKEIEIKETPAQIIAKLGLKHPVYAKLCMVGLL
ncbi:MAG: methionine adenosyltransferase domain-containing protein [Alphaproteobacteria bacterium]